ncbi:hypothetical protein SAMN04487949_1131 [Halogranum gelatinilyticum]|uniref:DUF2892 domain-containing protein n=1 Tax=Halogranum gelatinilyticum TaxID=660521 RepID=A0A1G9R3X9_9EURY|nr:hypothetical protein [Halogranum gelatinilyticum]SDM17135.1 hypothetical protein SAMN04487949_1131 [Halogranum gelatinilyticum]
MTEYQPGVCNIGRSEQRRRSALGALGLLATLAVVLWVFATDTSRLYLLVTAAPFFLVAEGFLQARSGFCPGFATAGIYDVSDDGGERQQVADAEARAADRRRARRLHLHAAGLAALATGVVFFVGTLVP